MNLTTLRREATRIGMGWTFENGVWKTATGAPRAEAGWDPVMNEQHALILLTQWYTDMVRQGNAPMDSLGVKMIGNGREFPFEWNISVVYKGCELQIANKNFGTGVCRLLAENVYRVG